MPSSRHANQLTQHLRPDFTISLLHSAHLPPTMARFLVPLNFNKYDLRDYLFHAYGVRALKIRSYVDQQPVTRNNAGRIIRPQSLKRMTVDMDKPFVWPSPPEDMAK